MTSDLPHADLRERAWGQQGQGVILTCKKRIVVIFHGQSVL